MGGRDRIVVGFITTYMQSVPITTNVVSSNPLRRGVLDTTLSDIKFVNDLRQVSGFLWVLGFPPSIKQTAMI